MKKKLLVLFLVFCIILFSYAGIFTEIKIAEGLKVEIQYKNIDKMERGILIKVYDNFIFMENESKQKIYILWDSIASVKILEPEKKDIPKTEK